MKHLDNFDNITISDLKKYAEYLIENYKKINASYKESRIYYDLKQFINDGRIKDLFHNNEKT